MKYRRIKLPEMNPEQVADEIGDFTVGYIVRMGKNGGVIGLSGGVDSTTTAALAQRAFRKYNVLTPKARYDRHKAKNPEAALELAGYMLPSKLNEPEDTKDAIEVAEKLRIRYEVKGISKIVESYVYTNPEIFNVRNDFHKGNLIAEVRASILHVKAAVENKLVLGTGNCDEDFGVAYYTLFGDGAVHLSPIGNLPKRLVKQMAVYLGFRKSAKRIPAAGLEKGQTDFKDLGYEYEDFVEPVREGLSQGFTLEELIKHPKIVTSAKKQIKLYEEKFGKKKFHNVEEMVYDFYRRNQIAKGKMSIVHPPIAPITLIYK